MKGSRIYTAERLVSLAKRLQDRANALEIQAENMQVRKIESISVANAMLRRGFKSILRFTHSVEEVISDQSDV